MDYNDDIRATRTGRFWELQNKKPIPPFPDLLIVLLHFLFLITSLYCSSSPYLYPIWPLQYLYPFAYNSNLFLPIPHFSFLFFPQTPHLNLVLFPSVKSFLFISIFLILSIHLSP